MPRLRASFQASINTVYEFFYQYEFGADLSLFLGKSFRTTFRYTGTNPVLTPEEYKGQHCQGCGQLFPVDRPATVLCSKECLTTFFQSDSSFRFLVWNVILALKELMPILEGFHHRWELSVVDYLDKFGTEKPDYVPNYYEEFLILNLEPLATLGSVLLDLTLEPEAIIPLIPSPEKIFLPEVTHPLLQKLRTLSHSIECLPKEMTHIDEDLVINSIDVLHEQVDAVSEALMLWQSELREVRLRWRLRQGVRVELGMIAANKTVEL